MDWPHENHTKSKQAISKATDTNTTPKTWLVRDGDRLPGIRPCMILLVASAAPRDCAPGHMGRAWSQHGAFVEAVVVICVCLPDWVTGGPDIISGCVWGGFWWDQHSNQWTREGRPPSPVRAGLISRPEQNERGRRRHVPTLPLSHCWLWDCSSCSLPSVFLGPQPLDLGLDDTTGFLGSSLQMADREILSLHPYAADPSLYTSTHTLMPYWFRFSGDP